MGKNIIIIGAGWYGCYSALLLQSKYNVIMIEKKSDIFDNSSYYNQNRLHLGFHYPRNYSTRILCRKYFDRFQEKFNDLLNNIDNNFYLISNKSAIDYKTYNSIYSFENYDFELKKNEYFNNIDGNIFKVNEKVINSDKTKNYFKNNLKCNIIFNKNVINVIINQNNLLTVVLGDGNEIICDMVIDCTFNSLGLSKKKYIYEKTISLLFKKKSNIDFGAITIMDGNFCSLYPRDIDNNIYTLTDVEHTPIYKSFDYAEIEKKEITSEEVEKTNHKMIKKISLHYKNFNLNFEYVGYFLSNKTKLLSDSDSRECIIENNNNIISVNCGKIIGIFELEDYFKKINLI